MYVCMCRHTEKEEEWNSAEVWRLCGHPRLFAGWVTATGATDSVRRCRELYNSTGTLHDFTELEWVAGSLVGEVSPPFFLSLYALFCPFLCVSLSAGSPWRSLWLPSILSDAMECTFFHVCMDQHQARRVSEEGFFPLTRLDRLMEKKMRVGVWEQAAEQLFIHCFSTRSSHLSHECLLCAALPVCLTPLLVLFWVFLLQAPLLLPLCFHYCLLWGVPPPPPFFVLCARHSIVCVISSGASVVSSNLHH